MAQYVLLHCKSDRCSGALREYVLVVKAVGSVLEGRCQECDRRERWAKEEYREDGPRWCNFHQSSHRSCVTSGEQSR